MGWTSLPRLLAIVATGSFILHGTISQENRVNRRGTWKSVASGHRRCFLSLGRVRAGSVRTTTKRQGDDLFSSHAPIPLAASVVLALGSRDTGAFGPSCVVSRGEVREREDATAGFSEAPHPSLRSYSSTKGKNNVKDLAPTAMG
ncbi:hypothetical protein LZ30DRAFT_286165 [Colletotrichum cereale]|nr:hypothetical protein LZ30DRAFT_286165 [Colletotrichum cereale]